MNELERDNGAYEELNNAFAVIEKANYNASMSLIPTWNKEYYEILEFFFWESQHLGKKKNPESNLQGIEQVFAHLRRMEVTLNHQFNLFFTLVPRSLLRDFFKHVFGHPFDDEYVFDSQETRKFVSMLGSVTQPDLFFVGRQSLVGIEMKVSAKSSLDQCMKYFLLSLLEGEALKNQKIFHLLFIGKGNFSNLFEERFESVGELQKAFAAFSMPDTSRNGGIDLKRYHEKIRKLAQKAEIAYISYGDMYNFFKEEREKYAGGNNGAETVCKLIDGLLDEIRARELL